MDQAIRSEDVETQGEISPFILIEKLQDAGINMGDITKLKAAGIHTVQSLVYTTKKVIRRSSMLFLTKHSKFCDSPETS